MPKKSYIRILLLFGIALVFTINGCVDTSVQPIPSKIDYQSSIKVVNLAEGLSSAQFSMKTPDGKTIDLGTIDFGTEDHAGSSFMDVPAGAKTLTFNNESLKFNTDVDKKIRIFVYGDAANRDFKKFTQRYIFQTTDDTTVFKPGKGAVAFINASNSDIDGIQSIKGSDTSMVSESTLEQGDMVGYTFMAPGQYTFNFMADGSIVNTLKYSVQALRKSTAAVYGSQSSLQHKVFTDD